MTSPETIYLHSIADQIADAVRLPRESKDAAERLQRERDWDNAIGLTPRQIEENAGYRIADDYRCACCGKRGVVGRFCQTCERS